MGDVVGLVKERKTNAPMIPGCEWMKSLAAGCRLKIGKGIAGRSGRKMMMDAYSTFTRSFCGPEGRSIR